MMTFVHVCIRSVQDSSVFSTVGKGERQENSVAQAHSSCWETGQATTVRNPRSHRLNLFIRKERRKKTSTIGHLDPFISKQSMLGSVAEKQHKQTKQDRGGKTKRMNQFKVIDNSLSFVLGQRG